MKLGRILPAAALALVAACASSKGPVAFVDQKLPLLLWLGEYTRPAGTPYPNITADPQYGSISGLAPDALHEQWIAVIDDRERSRIAWLKVAFSDKGFTVVPSKMQELRAAAGVDPNIVTHADLEAIVALPDGTYVLSEEGHRIGDTDQIWQPVLLRMTADGIVTSVINYPKAFQITFDEKTGVRGNQGFEGLAVTPRGNLIAGLEQPLFQDGPKTTFDRPAAGRLIEFVKSGSTFKPGKQWRYMISPTPRLENFDETCNDGENGLVDLLALSETRLISMERACVMTTDRQFTANTVQLFSVELVGDSARKQLLLNFKDLEPRVQSVLPRLENFEALTFGPIINGLRTLLIASDDNFRATQKTSFLLLGIK